MPQPDRQNEVRSPPGEHLFQRWDENSPVAISAITSLLNRAYQPLAARGMNYVAATQDDAVTLRRVAGRECWLLLSDGGLAGTITLTPPGLASGCNWYQQPGVATFGQFAVEPSLQQLGLGGALLIRAEHEAMLAGADELSLDTSEHADKLIAWYSARGYRHVGTADWSVTNYRSVVLSKSLHK